MRWQGSFAQAEYAGKQKQTRRDKFLAEMEQVVPWARLVERLRPLLPEGRAREKPLAKAGIGLERMLRIYFLQQWYGLADEALEDAFYDSQALRGFAAVDLAVETVPDATTLLHFRHWLERHELTKALFDEVAAMLAQRGLLRRQGTIPAFARTDAVLAKAGTPAIPGRTSGRNMPSARCPRPSPGIKSVG